MVAGVLQVLLYCVNVIFVRNDLGCESVWRSLVAAWLILEAVEACLCNRHPYEPVFGAHVR